MTPEERERIRAQIRRSQDYMRDTYGQRAEEPGWYDAGRVISGKNPSRRRKESIPATDIN